MPERDLNLLVSAAIEAGKIATPYWNNSPEIWEKDDNAGPVTEADLAVDAMLQNRLLTARPNYGWLSEETEDNTARLKQRDVFIVDPIDGTRAFIEGSKTWAHSLAIARDGQVVAAVVYLPLRDKMYTARLGGSAFLNGKPIQQSKHSTVAGAKVLSAKVNFEPKYWANGVPDIERHFRSSLAYRLASVADGRFDAMLTFRDTWEWDVAAGTLLATEAGANVTDRFGATPKFNNPHPAIKGMVAGSTHVHRGLCDHLG